MKPFRLFTGIILSVAAASCSVNYDNIYDTEGTVPELMLDEAVFKRVKDSKVSSEIQSKRLEEFKDSGTVLAQDIQFESRNDEGDVNSFGSAGLMKADTNKEIYEFYNGIHIEAPERGVVIDGDSLRWNGKTEQLSGEKEKSVTIKKDGVTLSGSGFSASAVSESFSFASNVGGVYVDKKEEESDGAKDEAAQE
jgi:LPS export ABC transporter protein LptC